MRPHLHSVLATSIALAASTAFAQITAQSNWTAIQTTLTDVGNTASTPGFTTYGTGSGMGQAKLTLTATHLGGTNQSQKEQRVTMSQTFTLGGASTVQVPRYYHGGISFFGPAGNLSSGLSAASWEIVNTTTNAVVANWNSSLGLTSAPNPSSINQANMSTVNLPAGNYRIDVKLTNDGYTRPTPSDSPPAGTGVTVDFHTDYRGAATSISAWPQAIWDTRAVVNAPAARTAFGVTGAGVDVGIIEVGRPYRNDADGPGPDTGDWSGAHPSLAGKLFIPTSIYNEAILTKYRDEHAQAVASIIASADANNANAGIAPGSTITTYSIAARVAAAGATISDAFRAGVQSLHATGVRVINMSMTTNDINTGADPNADNNFLDAFLNGHQNLVFVKSAGNNGARPTNGVTAPGTARNALAVGAIDTTMQRASFSSFGNQSGLNPFKPDLVAPGEYVNAAASFGGGFTRGFTADTFDTGSSPLSGEISGTSFAAPHVTGAAALLLNYYDNNAATHDPNAKVIKAVLLNGANHAAVTRNGGGAWAQVTSNVGGVHRVERSLDPELGAGLLDVNAALEQYKPAEIHLADGNTDVDHDINVGPKPIWWDHEQVAGNGTVDYFLDFGLRSIKATLVWNGKDDGTVSPMSMKLFYEGNTNGNVPGYDPTLPNDDVLLAETLTTFNGSDQNVNLLELLNVAQPPAVEFQDLLNIDYGRYYLSIFSLSADIVDYGLAVRMVIPEPATLVALIAFGVVGLRRR